MRINKGERERGATAVEAAVTASLLFLLLFGIAEFGLAFKDWLTVGHSAREAARAGATLGDDVYAQIDVLDNVAANMGTAAIADAGLQVRIFDPESGAEDTYTYVPNSLNCKAPGDCCQWNPCPDPDYTAAQGNPDVYVSPNYLPKDRDVSAPDTGRIGVQVFYTHNWITGILGFDPMNLTVTVDYAIEPRVFEA